MSTVSGWGDVGRPFGGSSGENKGKVNWLKLTAGQEVIIRPVGDPKPILKYFVRVNPSDKGRSAISDVFGKDCVIQKKYKDGEGNPLYRQQQKYVINCIDRADNQLKLIELPKGIAISMKEWGEENGANPGGPKGCDFKIKSVKTGNTPRDVEHKLFNRDRTPFSEEDLKLIANVYDIEKICAAVPQEELEKRLGLVESEEDSSGDDTASQAPAAKAKPQAATAAAGKSDEDLNF